jgi:hypothetical protein
LLDGGLADFSGDSLDLLDGFCSYRLCLLHHAVMRLAHQLALLFRRGEQDRRGRAERHAQRGQSERIAGDALRERLRCCLHGAARAPCLPTDLASHVLSLAHHAPDAVADLASQVLGLTDHVPDAVADLTNHVLSLADHLMPKIADPTLVLAIPAIASIRAGGLALP